MQGHPEATIPAIQNKLLPMMLANFAVWPIAHLINFKFIPSQQRILYINCIQVRINFWHSLTLDAFFVSICSH